MWLAARIFVKRRLAALRSAAIGPHAEAVLCRAGTHRFLVPATDFTIGRKLAFFGAYNDDEFEGLARLIREHDIASAAFVGSHVGVFVVRTAALVARVDAVEPNPATLALLRLNLHMNDCRNVTVHPMAASSAPATLRFAAERENTGGSHVVPPGEAAENVIEVRGDTVDSLGLSPGLLVIDVEGHEAEALRGMAATLPQVQALSCELIPAMAEAAGSSVAEIVGMLAPHFDRFHVDTLDAPALDAEGVRTWFEALRGDDRRISRNVIARKT